MLQSSIYVWMLDIPDIEPWLIQVDVAVLGGILIVGYAIGSVMVLMCRCSSGY